MGKILGSSWMPGFPDRYARREDGVIFLLLSKSAGPYQEVSPAMCLEGFTEMGQKVEKNYKMDETTLRDDLQRKLKGLRFT